MDKTAIKNFAIEARKILMKSAITEAGFYGITKEGCKDPVQKGKDFEVYETVAGTENRIFGADIKRRANLVQAIKTVGFDQVIEETAYTWFNRIIAIRFMEINNYLPTRVRVLSSETGSGTPDIITQADTVELNLSAEELEKIQTAKRENRYDDAFRLLFVKQCNELNAILPGLFEKTNDYMELLLRLSYTSDGVVRMLVDSIPEDNFNVETEGQVEIIGWMYQYYNTELKDDTFAKLKKNVKITKERIPAATQLFTPDWIVRYMVENSLGRVWIEHLRAVNPSVDEKTKAEEFGWKYYLPEAKQEEEVEEQLVEIRKSYRDLTPQDITCIDPCMGSGHILVYMFDVLMDIYRSEGFSEREAVFDILEKNIRGLDIDRRAYQLSYFALMMKARGYNRIFFRGRENLDGERVQANPQVYAIEESNAINREQLKYFGGGLDELNKNNALNQLSGFLDELVDAKEYGSILKIESHDWNLLKEFVAEYALPEQMDLGMVGIDDTQRKLKGLVWQGQILADNYDAVVTNPPYMGASNMNPKLNEFIRQNYADYKSDFFSAFVVHCSEMAKTSGYCGFFTPYVWMFIQSYEKMRNYLYTQTSIETLIQFEYSAFEEATVPVCTFVFENSHVHKKGCYLRLVDFRGGMDVQRKKTLEAIGNHDCGFYFEQSPDNFTKIPSSPVAYWASENFTGIYKKSDAVSRYGQAREGMATGSNDLFMRFWFEIEMNKMRIECPSRENALQSDGKWYPYNKGGNFRKWYGNDEYVVNWHNDGYEIMNFKDIKTGRIRSHNYNLDFIFKEGITWTALSSGNFGCRYSAQGKLADSKGSMLYLNSGVSVMYFLGLLNSCVSKHVLMITSPTLDFKPGRIAELPVILDNINKVEGLTKELTSISKTDWDSYETSWDFIRHPLVPSAYEKQEQLSSQFAESRMARFGLLSWHYEQWKQECNDRFAQLKANEEELNRIFIDIYGLQDELTPEVEDKDITVHHIFDTRDNTPESMSGSSYVCTKQDEIISFISYAVGCMFGRYSLDVDGLTYAGGDWENSKYTSFPADKDNIIPICDEEYFDDDIVSRFVTFVEVAYGKESLQENLQFIADALGGNGNPKEVIRSYFMNEFYKDHCKVYQKRPIYWLFDSGKANGFKCLIYLHRYNPDTVGLIQADYLSKSRDKIDNALKNAEYIIKTTSSAVDKAQATKKRDKYVKQLAEIRDYYPALLHIARQRIDLDLDDGVKVNYAKFQGVEVSTEGEKKQTVDLLAKI